LPKIAFALLLSSFAVSSAMADTCKGEAAAKKLGGAAKTSFTTKCINDAVGH
jgi:hypothetical protein